MTNPTMGTPSASSALSVGWIIITIQEVVRNVERSYINCFVTGLNWFSCYIRVFHRCVPPIHCVVNLKMFKLNIGKSNLSLKSLGFLVQLYMPSRKGKKQLNFGLLSTPSSSPSSQVPRCKTIQIASPTGFIFLTSGLRLALPRHNLAGIALR